MRKTEGLIGMFPPRFNQRMVKHLEKELRRKIYLLSTVWSTFLLNTNTLRQWFLYFNMHENALKGHCRLNVLSTTPHSCPEILAPKVTVLG